MQQTQHNLQQGQQELQALRNQNVVIQQNQQAQLEAIANQQNLTVAEKNASCRLLNQSLGVNDSLFALRNQLGVVPADFPETKTAFASHTVNQLNNLLQFYELPADGQKAVKVMRLLEFFGR